jgi:hypothetical protein
VSIEERHRIALHEAAKETWGPEVAVTLMEMLPATGWAEVATKTDLVAMKSDVALLGKELRTEMTELRAELHIEMADIRATLERGLRTNMMWTVGTMIAGFGGIAAVTALTR